MDRYQAWKAARVVTDNGILGGEPVFKGSRLAVCHVGDLLLRGHNAEVREDYPYLTAEDFEFAPAFTRAFRR